MPELDGLLSDLLIEQRVDVAEGHPHLDLAYHRTDEVQATGEMRPSQNVGAAVKGDADIADQPRLITVDW